MDEEQVLNLFEFHWFTQNPFSTKPTSLLPQSPYQTFAPTQTDQKPTLSRLQSRHVRSLSDDSNSKTSPKSNNPSSPISVLPIPKLATIPSGKVVEEIEEKEQKQEDDKFSGEKRSVRRKKLSKSLSELEFEEMSGFMELGFTFSEDEKDPRLVEIIPGLKRLGRTGESVGRASVSRPYLSESWVNQEPENQLIGLRLPLVGDGVDMKEQIRFWAHTVASTVR